MTEEFDAVVPGTDAAGQTPAVIAAIAGASVAVFGKAGEVGGTSAWPGGQVWIPNNPDMADHGIGIEPRIGWRAQSLTVGDGQVTGVRFDTTGGERAIRARGGVVLGTGGFEWDAELGRSFLRRPMTHPGSVRTNTGDGLKMVLAETVARWSGHVGAGADPDVLRGAAAYDRWRGDPHRKGQRDTALAPLARGPFHGPRVNSGALGTEGEPRTDANARLLDLDGQPILELHGVGNVIASPVGMTYRGPGRTIVPGTTFGYRAGRHAAARRTNQPRMHQLAG